MTTVAILTLGCKVNQSESSILTALFKEEGAEIITDDEIEADIYVINSCTVTHTADQKSRKIISKTIRQHPKAQIVVTGCYVETNAEALSNMPGVALFLGNDRKPNLVRQALELTKGRKEATNTIKTADQALFYSKGAWYPGVRSRVNLKIQDGCEQFCSYCIISHVRGKYRSMNRESVSAAVKEIVKTGCREIILTGIHLGAYGVERGERDGLGDLLESLLSSYPQTRFRLSSLEPMEASPNIVKLLKEYPNFCDHLHLPLQSGQDDILIAMNRPYTKEQYQEKVNEIRMALPEIAITSDIIVGFPGETEERFAESYKFIEELAFSRIHVFSYSARKGTPAESFNDQVPEANKKSRSQALISLGRQMTMDYEARFLGRRMTVIVESSGERGILEGRTSNYLTVHFRADNTDLQDIIGSLAEVEVIEQKSTGLIGHYISAIDC